MFKKDIDLIKRLHTEYGLTGPLLDAGGLENPAIADYEISAKKAIEIQVSCGTGSRAVRVPHHVQDDRYVKIRRPWEFIDPNYLILNPEAGGPFIEDLPALYPEKFSTVITVSVFEHVNDPYKVSDAIFKIVSPGGYFINSAPFLFPYHPSPEDNWRFSPIALRRIHERSGFTWIEGDFHIKHSTLEGIGDTNPGNFLAPQAVWASYSFCKKEPR